MFGVIRTKHGKGPNKVRTKPEQVPFLLPADAEEQPKEKQCNPVQEEATNSKALQDYTRKQCCGVLVHATAPHCKRLQKKAIAKTIFQNLSKTTIMAIMNKGILGPISGTVGTVIGGSWKDISYVRSQSTSRRTSFTQPQLEQQAKFSLTMKFLQL